MEMIETVRKEIKPAANQNTEELYKIAFPGVARFVKQMRGTFDDARDIFHDALVVFFEINQEKITASESAYILGIAKHLWIRKYNKSQSTVLLSNLEQNISVPDDYYPTVNNKRLMRFLESAGKKCMDLLRAFYYEKKQMKHLVRAMGFTSQHSASVQKYKCLEKVRDMVKEKSLAYEDFIE